MLLKQIESHGLAHYSYLIGDGTEALVIDPRRDVDIYIDVAQEHGMDLNTVLETHRNEDYLVGSLEVQRRTGAEVWHADGHLPYEYGKPVKEGDQWQVGRLKIEALGTPGHTPGSFSYLLYDAEGNPWAVFTGDALFAGDVGRVDFLGEDKVRDMAEQLHESLFTRLLSLDDGVIVFPAHGSGSACGFDIAERRLSSVGIERGANPALQHTEREAFVNHVGQVLDKAPHFERMEEHNLKGATPLHELATPRALSPEQFEREMADEDALVVDVRSELAFGTSHLPGSLFIFQSGLESFAGFFIPPDSKLLLVSEGAYPEDCITRLRRMGFDNIQGYLAGGLNAWQNTGRGTASVGTVPVQNLCRILDESNDYWLLDVRKTEELKKQGAISGAHHIPMAQIAGSIDDIPRDEHIYIFCGSGLRAMIVASILLRAGYENVSVALGGLKAWISTSCPIRSYE